jgi:hypothetical protein
MKNSIVLIFITVLLTLVIIGEYIKQTKIHFSWPPLRTCSNALEKFFFVKVNSRLLYILYNKQHAQRSKPLKIALKLYLIYSWCLVIRVIFEGLTTPLIGQLILIDTLNVTRERQKTFL